MATAFVSPPASSPVTGAEPSPNSQLIVFDALTSVRVYKSAFTPELARTMIEDEEGKHFDPAIVEAFRACYDRFLAVHAQHNVAEQKLVPA